ncbi:uncharacterized protein LOC125947686 [Dermacentor silvarum]|uniref:uncharacterized protein LOC125947686 n=1 Tax=Dermacentor silvarum TaxID=543639 RepID=UPI0021006FB4|nr:uncharacterized protein LOC125947686 [Dermacentor silvarum]
MAGKTQSCVCASCCSFQIMIKAWLELPQSLLRSQPWSRETFGIAKNSEFVSVNAIIDFVYATNAASDILLIWVICYVPLHARKDRTNETREANVTPDALIGFEAEGGVRFWSPLAVFTGVAFIRVAVLMYCFVGYLGLLSEAASDSFFDTPVDVIPSSTASLSSVRPSSSALAPREYGAYPRKPSQASTSHVSQTKITDTQTMHVETAPMQQRKPKRGVAVTPTLSSLSDGIVLRVVPGPTFKRPSYVCSVSPPNIRHSRHDDGGRSDEDSPSAGMPASFDAIHAATLFGTVPRRLGGTRLPSLAVPSLDSSGNRLQTDVAKKQSAQAPPAPIGELNTNATRQSSWTHSDNDAAKTAVVAAVETHLPSPAGEAVIAAKPSSESSAKLKRRERRRKGKHIAFGSHSRRGGRHALESGAARLTPTISPAGKKLGDKEMVTLDDHPSAMDDVQRRVADEDDVHCSSPTPESVTSMEGSSEVMGSMLSASRHVASPLVTFVFRTPPSSVAATPETLEDAAKSSAVPNRARGALIVAPPVVEKREQAVQTDIC